VKTGLLSFGAEVVGGAGSPAGLLLGLPAPHREPASEEGVRRWLASPFSDRRRPESRRLT
jgi:hypothetical protein